MKRVALVLLLGVAACTNAPKTPTVTAAAPPPTVVPPAPVATDWRDIPETVGGWTYVRDAAGSAAAFGRTGEGPDFILRCDRAANG